MTYGKILPGVRCSLLDPVNRLQTFPNLLELLLLGVDGSEHPESSFSLTFIVLDRIWGNGDPGSTCSSISVTPYKHILLQVIYYITVFARFKFY